MELKNLFYKVKCDVPGCNEFADYVIEKNGSSYKSLKFCSTCLNEIHKCYSKKIVPKSPKNMLNKTK